MNEYLHSPDDDSDDDGDCPDDGCYCWDKLGRLTGIGARGDAVEASWNCPVCGPCRFSRPALPARPAFGGEHLLGVVGWLAVATVAVVWLLK